MVDRRLPIYFLIDVSASMQGAPIKAVEDALLSCICEWASPDSMLSFHHLSVWISVIVFSDKAILLVPLKAVADGEFHELTNLRARITNTERSNIGNALKLICKCHKQELQTCDNNDFFSKHPVVYVISNGSDGVDGFEAGIRDFNQYQWGRVVTFTSPARSSSSLNLARIYPDHIFGLDYINNLQYDFNGLLIRFDEAEIGWLNILYKQLTTIYVAVDCSSGLQTLQIDAVKLGLRQLASDLEPYSCARRRLAIRLIGFNDDANELRGSDSREKVMFSVMNTNDRTDIKKVLKLVAKCAERDASCSLLPPVAVILTIDNNSDVDLQNEAVVFQKSGLGHMFLGISGNDTLIDTFRVLRNCQIYKLNELRSVTILSFFDRVSQFVRKQVMTRFAFE